MRGAGYLRLHSDTSFRVVAQERAAAEARRRHAAELRAQMAANAERERAAREAARSEGAEGRARAAAHQAAIEVRCGVHILR